MFTCNHISVRCSDIERSIDFYTHKLGLELLHRWPKMFAVRAGEIRISVFQSDEISTTGNIEIILRTNDIESAKTRLVTNGLTLAQDIVEAPGFMRFFTVEDPDANVIHIAEYLRDPLASGG
jgi:catechol 2,3-dioxygenase-like lactoylglutathione lyase family enzyme